MTSQIIGDGANLFILIVAVIIGFTAAIGHMDFIKVKNEEEKRNKKKIEATKSK